MEPALPRYEIVDHTSELTLRLRAPDLPGVLAEAARAFASLVPAELREEGSGEPVPLTVRLEGEDPGGVLVDWLNELAFRAEAESWIPLEVEARRAAEGPAVEVAAVGRRLSRPFVLVKAATFHDLIYRSGPRGVEAEVTLDI